MNIFFFAGVHAITTAEVLRAHGPSYSNRMYAPNLKGPAQAPGFARAKTQIFLPQKPGVRLAVEGCMSGDIMQEQQQ